MGCLTLSREQMGVWDERKVGDARRVGGLGLICKKTPQVQVKKKYRVIKEDTGS